MVTHNATILEQHLLLAGESPVTNHPHRRRRFLNKEDPMSHRIIEKRRRDRMNNCLADLSRLIPADYLKKGRGRIEKTEIIEMAIKHMKHLQAHACHQLDTCELANQQSQEENHEQNSSGGPIVIEHYRLGYQECLSEAMHFLVEVEGFFAGDPLCVQLINHLQKHCDKILKGDRLNYPRTHNGETTSTSSNSSGGGYNNHNCTTASGSSGMMSGSPTSGSCSDSGRTENKDSGISSGIPGPTSQSITAILPSEINGDDACCEDGLVNLSAPSQLREMLTNSNLTTLQSSQSGSLLSRSMNMSTTLLLQPPQSPVHSLSGSQYSSGACAAPVNGDQNCGGSSAASLYKFKNNIKQRFTAEHHIDENNGGRHTDDVTSNAVTPTSELNAHSMSHKRKRYSVENGHELNTGNGMITLATMTNMRRRDSETCSIPSSPASPPLPIPKYPPPSPSPDLAHSPPPPLHPNKSFSNPSYGVPIFALHAKGSFYIPLTLESELLAPYLAAVGFGTDMNSQQTKSSSESVVLHPVTISVNFQQTNHRRIQHHSSRHANQCSSVAAWKNEVNGFVPIPRWPVYSPDRN